MTFVLVGGGPTGVELAGALGEIARDTLRRDFRSIDTAAARILLVEAMDRILPTYPPDRSVSAQRQLERLGATVRTETRVVDVDERSVTVEIAGGTRGADPDPDRRCGRPAILAAAFVADGREGRRRRRPIGPAGSSSSRTSPSRAIPRSSPSGDAAVSRGSRTGPCPASPRAGSRADATRRGRSAAASTASPSRRSATSTSGDVAVIGRLSGVTDIRWLGPFGRQSGFAAWALWLGHPHRST